jgi:GNAT superfamily N-acetyltransferase
MQKKQPKRSWEKLFEREARKRRAREKKFWRDHAAAIAQGKSVTTLMRGRGSERIGFLLGDAQVGFAHVYTCDGVLTLEEIFIYQRLRRQGYGRQALAALTASARAVGIRRIIGYVIPNDVHGLYGEDLERFYTRAGFRVTHYPGDHSPRLEADLCDSLAVAPGTKAQGAG